LLVRLRRIELQGFLEFVYLRIILMQLPEGRCNFFEVMLFLSVRFIDMVKKE
jgi:hypothetical protein